MKAFISGLAIIILLIFILIYQSDTYYYRLECQNLKYCCEEASNTATLYYNLDKNDKKIFDEQEGIRAIEKTIQNYIKDKNADYIAYFFDDDLQCSVYKNGTKTEEFTFTYPYLYTDSQMLYKKTVASPTIIVTINAGKFKYRIDVIEPILIRSSGYEYDI